MSLPFARLGPLEKLFLALVVLNAVVWALGRPFAGAELLRLAAYAAGLVLLVRLGRRGARRILWRVRNRMIVLFLFIGLVPLLLVSALVGLAGYVLTGQVAVLVMTAELERRTARLQGSANALVWTMVAAERSGRPEWVQGFVEQAGTTWPGLKLWARGGGPTNEFEEPQPQIRGFRGIVRRQGRLYLAAYASTAHRPPPAPPAPPGGLELVLLQPLNEPFLSEVEPEVGRISYYSRTRQATVAAASRSNLPPSAHRFDYEVVWGTAPFAVPGWTEADQSDEQIQLRVQTRPSAVYRRLFGQGMEVARGVTGGFLILGTLFLIVELVSLVTGISITRTVTRSVHELYEGTQRVNQGIFSYRVPLVGNDQLAELSRSFNRMTESIERLIEESKERERLASELEIAREVQAQLFPKSAPEMRTLEIVGVCNAARMVSGDYFDFVKLPEDRLALAIGDVAGKGISGALLMASIQSMLRSQLSMESANCPRGADGGPWRFPTADLVSRLNRQLYENTTPEKYATFFFGAYDDRHGLLTYTNAGHLPPVLIRDGAARRLAVNGLVVGAFPFATYEQTEVELEPGDLLVAFTDGATEPENEFAEEFGETRLIELLVRHAGRPAREIIDEVVRAVTQWTGRPELQDDMTLMVARRR